MQDEIMQQELLNKKINRTIKWSLVLPILAYFAAIIVVMFVVRRQEYPLFGGTLVSYMWIFFLFVPFPLMSLLIGINYARYKYPCKKNIIISAIVAAILTIYGFMSFVLRNNYSRDFEYVNFLEEKVNFGLPDKGDVLASYNAIDSTRAYIVVYCEESPNLSYFEYNMTMNHYLWRDAMSLPYSIANESWVENFYDVDYFCLCDITTDYVEYNVIAKEKLHRYVLLGYDIDNHILKIVDFIY